MNNAGIIIQDVEATIQCDFGTTGYAGLAKYYSFPLTYNFCGRFQSNVAELLKRAVCTDLATQITYIPNLRNAFEYAQACQTQGKKTRVLFFEVDAPTILWEGEIPTTLLLGYEFAYNNYSDPEFIYLLANEPSLMRFRNQLNQYGLFESRSKAEEFGKTLYTLYPYLEEEMPFAETFVFEIREVSF